MRAIFMPGVIKRQLDLAPNFTPLPPTPPPPPPSPPPPPPPPTPGVWNVVPAPSFLQDSGSTYNVAATVPSGYVAGGVMDAINGTQLPAGFTFNEAGVLTEAGASLGTTAGVQFGYAEPHTLPTLTLHPTVTGTLPYHATWYPNEGVVPAGYSVSSPDDVNVRGSVLTTWPDGSAQIIVLAGETAVTNGVTKPIRLRVAVPTGSNLTTSRINAIVSTVTVNFGGGLQTLTLASATPDRIWWANPATICARYRLSCGIGTMEAVIDIHAFKAGVSNRAFVEVVVENGKVNANASPVVAPFTQSYTSAIVAVNGTTIATVSSPTPNMAPPRARISGGRYTAAGGHTPFRAWYCNGWVGGNPGIDVTHDTESMQAHPWFFRRAVPSAENLNTKYAQSYDTYEPWALGRLRYPGVNGGGADEEIGLVTATQADYLLSGNRAARNAVIATGLAPLSLDLSYRHLDGSVVNRTQVVGKHTSNGLWPRTPFTSSNNEFIWGGDGSYVDGSHVSNISLVPFLCRPSPCFIELAQKEFLFHHTNYNSLDGSHPYDQPRARGWRARNMATAIFLTPDAGTWNTGAEADAARKAAYRVALVNQINVSRNFMDQSWNLYKHITAASLSTTTEIDNNSTRPRIQAANYMHWLIALSWNSIANGKVLRGADQTMMEAAALQILEFPLRWFNDTSDYRWRGIAYQSTVGIQSGNQVIPQYTSVIDEHYYDVAGTPPSGPGPWLNFGTDTYNWSGASPQLVAGTGSFYPEHAWFVLCCAVERGAPGAEAAWTKVYGSSGDGGITNFSTWLNGMGNDRPYLNRFPRNK